MACSIVSRDIKYALGAVGCLAQWIRPAMRSIFPKCFPPQSSMDERSPTSLASRASKYCFAHSSASESSLSSPACVPGEIFSKSRISLKYSASSLAGNSGTLYFLLPTLDAGRLYKILAGKPLFRNTSFFISPSSTLSCADSSIVKAGSLTVSLSRPFLSTRIRSPV